MTEIPATVLSIHDVGTAPAPCIEGLDWRPLRDALGVSAFGMNAYVGSEPGQGWCCHASGCGGSTR